MEGTKNITRRQFFCLASLGLLSPIIRLLPKLPAAFGGTAAWLSPLAAIPGLVFLTWIAGLCIRDCRPGEGLAELFCRYLGRGCGRIAAGLFGLWILAYGGFILRAGAERLLSTIYGEGKLFFFVAAVLLLALLAARGPLRSLARAAEVFFLVLLGTLITVLLFSLPQLRGENLLPIYGRDLSGIALAGLPVTDVLSPWVYLLFLYAQVERRQGEKALLPYALKWEGLWLLLALLLLLTTIGCFGLRFLLELQAPFFTMVRNVRIFQVIERIESVVVGIWVIADFALVAALLRAGGVALGCSLGVKDSKWLIYAGAGLTLLVSLFIVQDSFAFARVSERLIPAVNMVFAFLLLPLICLVGKVRKKFKKGIDIG